MPSPRSDWNIDESTSHRVQFYDSDDFLVDQLSQFIGGALGSGDAAVVLATPEHRTALDLRLARRGLDVGWLKTTGRYLAVDAAEMLERCSDGGWPNAERFCSSIGEILARARGASHNAKPRVAVFGELVASQQANTRTSAAIELENLWNDLSHSVAFNLLCAYPMKDFGHERDGESLQQICDAHAHVYPAESYTSLDDADERLRAITELQHRSAALETEIQRRKRVQQLLKRREAELSEFLESALEGIQQIGADGRIEWANRATTDLLGYSPDEYLGRDADEFFVNPARFDALWQRIFRHDDVYDFPAELRHRDGSTKYVLIHANGRWENEQFLNARCFVRDDTDRHLMSTALRERNDELRRALEARDEFLSVAAHELKTPITGMRGFAQLLLRDLRRDKPIPPQRIQKALETIDLEASRLARLVARLLDTSDVKAGHLDINCREVDLISLVQNAIDRLNGLVVHSVEFQGPEQLIAVVDPLRIDQVVLNVLENAVRFSPDGGTIRVTVESQAENWARISVSDPGPGIPPEQRPALFDLYRQKELHRHLSGMGVGLYLSAEIVTLHGGRIEIEDPESGGSRFVVLLPITPDVHAAERE